MSGRVLIVFAECDAVESVCDVLDRVIDRMGSNGKFLPPAPGALPGGRGGNDEAEPDENADDDEKADDAKAVQPIAVVRSLPVNGRAATEIDVLRALANAGAPLRAGLIAQVLGNGTGKVAVSALLQKLRREGLAEVLGEKSKATWQPTAAGIKKLADLVVGKNHNGNGNAVAWSAESRRLYAYLTSEERACGIQDVLDDLQWSRTLFDRAVNREEFTVRGNVVELTP